MLFFFFFNDTATTEIYTLSLHDALPICSWRARSAWKRWISASIVARSVMPAGRSRPGGHATKGWKRSRDRKSTRLNSSHLVISYAVFCLKKKKTRIDYRQVV